MSRLKNIEKRFWLTLLILTGLRLCFVGRFELAPDEAYYWAWSRHLAWAYYDQGPMLAWFIRFFTTLSAANTETSVRLGAVLLSALTSWVFFVWLRKMFRDARAAWLGFLALQAALLFAVGAVLMMHDSLMMCAWVAALFFFYRALFEDWQPGWALGAAALGAGALSKYSMALFVPCLLLFLLLSRRHRSWWRRPHLYLAGLFTLLLVSPLLVWNSQHGWASFGHVAFLGGTQKNFSLSLQTAGEFIAGQLAVMTPLLGAFCLAAPVIAWRAGRRDPETREQYLFLACFSAPILLFFLLLSVHTRIYANWAAPAYPAALAILAGWVQNAWNSPASGRVRAWVGVTLGLAAALTLAVHVEAVWGFPPLRGRAAASLDRIRGWHALGQEAGERLRELRRREPRSVFLAARRYQIAAELSFYTPGQPPVQLLPEREPANNQYRFWDRSGLLAGQDALFVCEDGWEASHLQSRFDRIETLPVFRVYDRGRFVREIRFFLGRGFRPAGVAAVHYARRGPGRQRP